MGLHPIGDVERLLRVRAHVLRYWEREVPLLSPAKGQSGRREYSESDIALMLRLKHLIYGLRMSLDDASDALEREGASDPETGAAFAELRASLVRAYFESVELRKRAAAGPCYTSVTEGDPPCQDTTPEPSATS